MACCLYCQKWKELFLQKNSEQCYKLKYSDEDIFSNPGTEDLDVMERGENDDVTVRRSAVSDIEDVLVMLYI